MRDEENYNAKRGEIRRNITFQVQVTAIVLFKRDATLFNSTESIAIFYHRDVDGVSQLTLPLTSNLFLPKRRMSVGSSSNRPRRIPLIVQWLELRAILSS